MILRFFFDNWMILRFRPLVGHPCTQCIPVFTKFCQVKNKQNKKHQNTYGMELLYRLGPIKVNSKPKSNAKRILDSSKILWFSHLRDKVIYIVALRPANESWLQLCYLAWQCFDHNVGPWVIRLKKKRKKKEAIVILIV